MSDMNVDPTSAEFENARLFYVNDDLFRTMVEACVEACIKQGWRIEDVALLAKYREQHLVEQMTTLGLKVPPKQSYLERQLTRQIELAKQRTQVQAEVDAMLGNDSTIQAVTLVVMNNRVVDTGGVRIPRPAAEAFTQDTGIEIPEEFIED